MTRETSSQPGLEPGTYVCPCGETFTVARRRWLDAAADPRALAQWEAKGAFEGFCPSCGARATGWAPTVLLGGEGPVLLVPEGLRGLVPQVLADHLELLGRDAGLAARLGGLTGRVPPLRFLRTGEGASPSAPVEPHTEAAAEIRIEALGSSQGADGEMPDAVDELAIEELAVEELHSSELAAKVADPGELAVEESGALELVGAGAAVEELDSADLTALEASDAFEEASTAPGAGRVNRDDATVVLGPEDLLEDSARHVAPGIPELVTGSSDRSSSSFPGPGSARLGAHVGHLLMDGPRPKMQIRLDAEGFAAWAEADLNLRPIHLRDLGYPLLGLRVEGHLDGERGCLDAVLDVGEAVAGQVFRALATDMAVHLEIDGPDGTVARRDLAAPQLARNAAMCLESAQASLASGDHPPQAFGAALRALAAQDARTRLAPADPGLRPGSYEHLLSAREAWQALEHLDRVSDPQVLGQVIERDGLPFEEFDAIRRRVLAAALHHGLCAPRRFWRRIVGSGLAPDLPAYAAILAENRAADLAGEDDLDEDDRVRAWQDILALCERKGIAPPSPLREALGLPEPSGAAPAPSPQVAAGEIEPRQDTRARWERRLQDPAERLRAITEALQDTEIDSATLAMVLDALDGLGDDELLAVLPDLPRLGKRVVPGLVARLSSDRREVRQAAAIVLGMIGGRPAVTALADHMLREPTSAWMDAARALGAQGTLALDILSARIRRVGESEGQERLVRALAEIAAAEPRVCERLERMARAGLAPGKEAAARIAARALEVRVEAERLGRQIRGELPLTEVTAVRGFSRRAHEAILLPEIDLEEAPI